MRHIARPKCTQKLLSFLERYLHLDDGVGMTLISVHIEACETAISRAEQHAFVTASTAHDSKGSGGYVLIWEGSITSPSLESSNVMRMVIEENGRAMFQKREVEQYCDLCMQPSPLAMIRSA